MSSTQIFDRGYRHYLGERGSTQHAVVTLMLFSLGRTLGIKRGLWAKILPITIMLIAFLPAIVFVGVAIWLPANLHNLLPGYAAYYGFITTGLVLFSAFVAPEVLCTDRRTRLLGLYLASPLNRTTYLLAKVLAVATTLTFVTIGPVLLQLLGYTIQGSGPDGPVNFVSILLRIFAGGLVMSALYGSLSLAISSFTDRISIAAAGILMVMLLSPIVANALTIARGAEEAGYEILINIFALPLELVNHIFVDGSPTTSLSPLVIGFGNLAWVMLFTGTLFYKYHRLDVTR